MTMSEKEDTAFIKHAEGRAGGTAERIYCSLEETKS
jgi:hypothetical protein